MSEIRYRVVDGPVMPFMLTLDVGDELRAEWISTDRANRVAATRGESAMLDDLTARLESYFAGGRVQFDDVPVPKGTAFQRRCWAACRRIPYGSTISYGELASQAGSGPGASRAAGQAMRRNPLPILVPCHRVIAADGRLQGFAGRTGGQGQWLALKSRLLELEGALIDMPC